MKRNKKILFALPFLALLISVSFPFWNCGCGVRYMPKPKVIVEGEDPEVSFYATILALNKLGYSVQAVDSEAKTIVTEPKAAGSYWWQFEIAVAANGHVAVNTRTNLEIQRGAQTLTHKGIVNRSIDLSKHIRNIIFRIPGQQIIADGSALLPTIVTTPETQLVIPGM